MSSLSTGGRRGRRIVSAGVLIGTGGVLLLMSAWPGLGRQSTTPPPRPLSLEVERTGTDLWVTWDSDSPAIRGAKAGRLTIEDGGTTKALDLDLDQLRSAAVLYSPSSGDVSFRLTVFAPEPVSESVRISSVQEGGAGPAKTVPRLVQPKPVERVQPTMTPALLMLLRSMSVPTVQIDVAMKLDETGRVGGAQALTTGGDLLHRMLASVAVETARRWRFAPGQLNGKPITSTAVFSFQFSRPAR
jgi:hypothetical protein